MKTRAAQIQDGAALVAFINRAYRQSHPNSWTNEVELFDGDRIDEIQMMNLLGDSSNQFMLHEDEAGLVGCICVHDHGAIAYISLFAITPDLQARGFGKSVLATAEEYIYYFNEKVKRIHIPVYAERPELIAFYERQGYQQVPVEAQEEQHIPLVLGQAKKPLQNAMMEKLIDR